MAIKQKSLAATGSVTLGDAGHAAGCTWVIQLSGTWTGSVAFTGWLASPDLSASDAVTMSYTTPTSSTLASTALTANGIVFIRADGLSIKVDFTRTTGTLLVNATPVYA